VGTSCSDRFFERYLFRFVTSYRSPLMFLALMWLAFSAWRALTLSSVSY
jgi:hypothetical protein